MTDRPRILIVDDEPDVRTMLTRFFEKNDFVVDSAPDGPMALDKIGQNRPDLVLLDNMMPSMSGLDAPERHYVASTRPDPTIPKYAVREGRHKTVCQPHHEPSLDFTVRIDPETMYTYGFSP